MTKRPILNFDKIQELTRVILKPANTASFNVNAMEAEIERLRENFTLDQLHGASTPPGAKHPVRSQLDDGNPGDVQPAAFGRLDARLINPRELLTLTLELSQGLPTGLEWVTPSKLENMFKLYDWCTVQMYSVGSAVQCGS